MNVQAVPTTYVDVRNNTIPTYQYSVTEYFKVRATAADPAARQIVEGEMECMPVWKLRQVACVCAAAL